MPEGTWAVGGGIEIPCQYTIIGPKVHKKNCRKELRKVQLYCVINNKRKAGLYRRGIIFGWAYIRVEKRVTNLGGLYSGELIHGGGGGGLFTEFYGIL